MSGLRRVVRHSAKDCCPALVRVELPGGRPDWSSPLDRLRDGDTGAEGDQVGRGEIHLVARYQLPTGWRRVARCVSVTVAPVQERDDDDAVPRPRRGPRAVSRQRLPPAPPRRCPRLAPRASTWTTVATVALSRVQAFSPSHVTASACRSRRPTRNSGRHPASETVAQDIMRSGPNPNPRATRKGSSTRSLKSGTLRFIGTGKVYYECLKKTAVNRWRCVG